MVPDFDKMGIVIADKSLTGPTPRTATKIILRTLVLRVSSRGYNIFSNRDRGASLTRSKSGLILIDIGPGR